MSNMLVDLAAIPENMPAEEWVATYRTTGVAFTTAGGEGRDFVQPVNGWSFGNVWLQNPPVDNGPYVAGIDPYDADNQGNVQVVRTGRGLLEQIQDAPLTYDTLTVGDFENIIAQIQFNAQAPQQYTVPVSFVLAVEDEEFVKFIKSDSNWHVETGSAGFEQMRQKWERVTGCPKWGEFLPGYKAEDFYGTTFKILEGVKLIESTQLFPHLGLAGARPARTPKQQRAYMAAKNMDARNKAKHYSNAQRWQRNQANSRYKGR